MKSHYTRHDPTGQCSQTLGLVFSNICHPNEDLPVLGVYCCATTGIGRLPLNEESASKRKSVRALIAELLLPLF